jgi:hypothetical protein
MATGAAEELSVAERSNERGEGIFAARRKNELRVASASVVKVVIARD